MVETGLTVMMNVRQQCEKRQAFINAVVVEI